jgi:hypothetical protein
MRSSTLIVDQLSRGLYLVKTSLPNKPGEHYAILDIGNVLRMAGVVGPLLYELGPRGVLAALVTAELIVLERIQNEAAAIERFAAARQSARYSLLFNNCEHFATYVARGVRTSEQAQAVGIVATIAATLAVIALLPGKPSAV